MLEIASGLALQKHSVSVLSGGPAQTERTCGMYPVEEYGVVHYLSPECAFLDTSAQVSNLSRVNVLIVVDLVSEAHQELLDVMRRLSNPDLKVCMWCHSIHAGNIALLERVCALRKVPLLLVGVSDFVRDHVASLKHPETGYVTISNAVNPIIFDVNSCDVREDKSFVFCALYERGGSVARAVHALLQTRGLQMGAMYVCSYSSYGNSTAGPSLSKTALASRLRSCEYMVYPLVLESGAVHPDTHACCVLEAMASGVLVVAWDVACLRGVFGDLITLVPAPVASLAVSALADAVSSLIALPAGEREARRKAARVWAMQQTWDKRVVSLLSAVSMCV